MRIKLQTPPFRLRALDPLEGLWHLNALEVLSPQWDQWWPRTYLSRHMR